MANLAGQIATMSGNIRLAGHILGETGVAKPVGMLKNVTDAD